MFLSVFLALELYSFIRKGYPLAIYVQHDTQLQAEYVNLGASLKTYESI